MKEIPNIHLFEVYERKFLYDIDTNAIIELPKEVYDSLADLLVCKNETELKFRLSDLDDAISRNIAFLENQGLLHPVNKNLKIEHIETGVLQEIYNGNLSMMTLQVTQNCNLRCKYCVYSGSYINRIHTNKRMDWEIARKAVDFYYEHSRNSTEAAVGFYGGEPLLELELIKKVVDYAEALFKGKKISFNMTTNATMLTNEVVEYMLEHNFHIAVSLDGPKKIQDSNRVFADKERGTFDTVMENLENIRKMYPEFIEKISFNAVIDLSKDVGCANDFFMSYDMVKDVFVMGNMINDANRKEKIDINRKFFADAKYEEFKVFLYYCTNIFHEYKPTLMDGRFRGIKQMYYNRMVARNSKTIQDCPGGQCLPGAQRFFVNAYGNFYPCERVNEEADAFCIGNIDDGFDMNKVSELLNVAKLTEKECKNCWCFRLCSQCIARAEENGELSRSQRLSNCADMRKQVESDLKDYIVLCDYHCDFM